jgi:hypothetical protein
MRRFESSSPLYRIEFAPRAWAQIGALRSEEYRAVQAALRGVADGAGSAQPASESPPVHSLALEGLLLTYAIDGEARVVRLLNLARVSPAAP